MSSRRGEISTLRKALEVAEGVPWKRTSQPVLRKGFTEDVATEEDLERQIWLEDLSTGWEEGVKGMRTMEAWAGFPEVELEG